MTWWNEMRWNESFTYPLVQEQELLLELKLNQFIFLVLTFKREWSYTWYLNGYWNWNWNLNWHWYWYFKFNKIGVCFEFYLSRFQSITWYLDWHFNWHLHRYWLWHWNWYWYWYIYIETVWYTWITWIKMVESHI